MVQQSLCILPAVTVYYYITSRSATKRALLFYIQHTVMPRGSFMTVLGLWPGLSIIGAENIDDSIPRSSWYISRHVFSLTLQSSGWSLAVGAKGYIYFTNLKISFWLSTLKFQPKISAFYYWMCIDVCVWKCAPSVMHPWCFILKSNGLHPCCLSSSLLCSAIVPQHIFSFLYEM